MQTTAATRNVTRSSFASATGGFVTTTVRVRSDAATSRGQGATVRR